jgi:regulation of enolase protein 1 (concanavalin A-like superfamily)
MSLRRGTDLAIVCSWRKTFYGYITDNGHLFYVPVSGDFVVQARVNGEFAA